MRTVHHCKVCGFLSTRGNEFTRIDGVVIDKVCAQDMATDPRIAMWFEQARKTAQDGGGKGEQVNDNNHQGLAR